MNSNTNYISNEGSNSPITTPPFNPINEDNNNIPQLILNNNNIINDTTNLIQLYNNYIYYILYTMTFYNNQG
jgi:hypothetical protein